MTISVTNSAPLGTADEYSVAHDATLFVSLRDGVLRNDSDPDFDFFSAKPYTGRTAHGELELHASGALRYEPDAGFVGDDQFDYAIVDGAKTNGLFVESQPVAITFHVTGLPPAAHDDEYVLAHDTPLTVSPAQGFFANDLEPDGDPLTIFVISDVQHGTLVRGPAGSFTYTPHPGFAGDDALVYELRDGTCDEQGEATVSQAAVVTFHVSNFVPFAAEDSYAIGHDATLLVPRWQGVLSNDRDFDGDPLTIVWLAGAAHGTLTADSSGSFSYTPAPGFSGTDTFQYKLLDGTHDAVGEPTASNIATLTIEVRNSAPAVHDDDYVVRHDTPLIVPQWSGLLANDGDTDGDAARIVWVSGPAHGGLLWNDSGSFSYRPTAGFIGTDTFLYRISDGLEESGDATVTVEVTNATPAAADDSYSIAHGGTLILPQWAGVLANDSDPDGDPLTAHLVSGPAHGQLQLNRSGSLTYTPAGGFVGDDTFTYRADEGARAGPVATVTVHVINTAPAGFADSYSAAHDEFLTVSAWRGVLSNDGDMEGDPLTVRLESGPEHGVLLLDPNGSFSYRPAPGFVGGDAFTYALSDGFTDSSPVTVSLSVENAAPIAAEDTYSATHNETLLPPAWNGLLRNDADADGDHLTAVLVAGASHGALFFGADGTFSYIPYLDFIGTDSFTYRVTDGLADSAAVAVTINVAAASSVVLTVQPPTAADDVYIVSHGRTLNVTPGLGVTLNDLSATGDLLTVQLVAGTSAGTLSLAADGLFIYKPAVGFAGTDQFTYRASDGAGVSGLATVTITVSDAVPDAADDDYSIHAGDELNIPWWAGVLANDADAEDDALTAVLLTSVEHGTLDLNEDGSFHYVPAADYFGTDSFTYLVHAGANVSEASTVTLTVADEAPEAAADHYELTHDGVLTAFAGAGLLANDWDDDGDHLSLLLLSDVEHGTLSVAANGAFVYTPAAGFVGSDGVSYLIGDGVRTSAVASVTFDVTDAAPTAEGESYRLRHDGVLTVPGGSGVLANDTDSDGDMLALSLIADVEHGTLTRNADGSFRYVPHAGFVGADQFIYQVSDGLRGSEPATATFEVTNAAPTAEDGAFTLVHDRVLTVDASQGLLGDDIDDDGDRLRIALGTNVTHGTLTLASNGFFRYIPDAGYVGADSFTFTVSDGLAASASATVLLAVTNSAPETQDDVYRTAHDTALYASTGNAAAAGWSGPDSHGVLANDTDGDGDVLQAILVTLPAHGTVTFKANGAFVYTPNAGYVGTDSFTYRASDGLLAAGASPTAPTSAASGGTEASPASSTPTPVVPPTTGGELVGSAVSPEVSPLPQPAAPSAGDNTVTIEVTNAAPVVQGEEYTVHQGNILSLPRSAQGLLANDSDNDGDVLTAVVVTQPAHGLLTLKPNGAFLYTPFPGYEGADSFGYTVSDGSAVSAEATATIEVVNDAPVAHDKTYGVLAGTALTVGSADALADEGVTGSAALMVPYSVLYTDTDANGDALTAVLMTPPSHGTLTLQGDGSFTYMPAAGFTGEDSFIYAAADGSSFSEPAAVTLMVTEDAWEAAKWNATALRDAAIAGKAREQAAPARAAAAQQTADEFDARAAYEAELQASWQSYGVSAVPASAALRKELVTAENGYAAVLDASNSLLLATWQIAAADYAVTVNAEAVAYQTSRDAAGRDYRAALAAARSNYDDALSRAGTVFDTAVSQAERARLNTLAAADVLYHGALAGAETVYQDVLGVLDADYAATMTASAGLRDVLLAASEDARVQALAAAQSGLQASLDAAQAAFSTRAAQASAARGSAVSQAWAQYEQTMSQAASLYAAGPADAASTSPLDLASDSGYVQAAGAARAACEAALAGADTAYDAAMTAARAALDTAVRTADDDYDLAAAAADAVYRASLASANASFAVAVAAASAAYDTAAEQADNTYRTALAAADGVCIAAAEQANAVYNQKVANARAGHTAADESARFLLDTALALAQAVYDQTVNQENQAYVQASRAALSSHASAAGTAAGILDQSVAAAQGAYAQGVAQAYGLYAFQEDLLWRGFDASAWGAVLTRRQTLLGKVNTYQDSARAEENTYNAAVRTAQAALTAAERQADFEQNDALQIANDNLLDARDIYEPQRKASLPLEPPPAVTAAYRQAQKDFAVAQAWADVQRVQKRGANTVAFVRLEQAASLTKALHLAQAEADLSQGQAEADHTFQWALATADSVYGQGEAGAINNYQTDVTVASAAQMTAAANAYGVWEEALALARQQYALDAGTALLTWRVQEANAAELQAGMQADAQRDYAIAAAAALETWQTDLSNAGSAWVSAEAGAARTWTVSWAQAEAAWTAARADAAAGWQGSLAAAGADWQGAAANAWAAWAGARADAAADWTGQVAPAWAAYTTAAAASASDWVASAAPALASAAVTLEQARAGAALSWAQTQGTAWAAFVQEEAQARALLTAQTAPAQAALRQTLAEGEADWTAAIAPAEAVFSTAAADAEALQTQAAEAAWAAYWTAAADAEAVWTSGAAQAGADYQDSAAVAWSAWQQSEAAADEAFITAVAAARVTRTASEAAATRQATVAEAQAGHKWFTDEAAASKRYKIGEATAAANGTGTVALALRVHREKTVQAWTGARGKAVAAAAAAAQTQAVAAAAQMQRAALALEALKRLLADGTKLLANTLTQAQFAVTLVAAPACKAFAVNQAVAKAQQNDQAAARNLTAVQAQPKEEFSSVAPTAQTTFWAGLGKGLLNALKWVAIAVALIAAVATGAAWFGVAAFWTAFAVTAKVVAGVMGVVLTGSRLLKGQNLMQAVVGAHLDLVGLTSLSEAYLGVDPVTGKPGTDADDKPKRYTSEERGELAGQGFVQALLAVAGFFRAGRASSGSAVKAQPRSPAPSAKQAVELGAPASGGGGIATGAGLQLRYNLSMVLELGGRQAKPGLLEALAPLGETLGVGSGPADKKRTRKGVRNRFQVNCPSKWLQLTLLETVPLGNGS